MYSRKERALSVNFGHRKKGGKKEGGEGNFWKEERTSNTSGARTSHEKNKEKKDVENVQRGQEGGKGGGGGQKRNGGRGWDHKGKMLSRLLRTVKIGGPAQHRWGGD